MKILVTGGAGYVGSWMVPHLLAAGHKVIVFDIQWFGDGFLSKAGDNENLKLIVGDIRDLPKLTEALQGIEAVIHLACVSNDHSCQLDEVLSTSINFDAFEPMVIAAKKAGVKRFIYCSSSSVYGISDAPDVFEDAPLVPVTLYNRYKAACEPLLFKHQSDDFVCTIIRPATVCGYAPRMRFDLTVNIITAHAVLKNEITVFGGAQRRPNLHIKDMTECYKLLLVAPSDKIAGQIFNVGAQNMKVSDIAELVADVVYEEKEGLYPRPTITTQPSTDTRSYHVNSDKIFHVLGFAPKFTVKDAVRDLCVKFTQGYWKDALTNPLYSNVRQLVEQGFAITDSLASYRTDRYT